MSERKPIFGRYLRRSPTRRQTGCRSGAGLQFMRLSAQAKGAHAVARRAAEPDGLPLRSPANRRNARCGWLAVTLVLAPCFLRSCRSCAVQRPKRNKWPLSHNVFARLDGSRTLGCGRRQSSVTSGSGSEADTEQGALAGSRRVATLGRELSCCDHTGTERADKLEIRTTEFSGQKKSAAPKGCRFSYGR